MQNFNTTLVYNENESINNLNFITMTISINKLILHLNPYNYSRFRSNHSIKSFVPLIRT